MTGTPCWDHMKCGKQAACPAYPNRGFDCWNVEATLCRGERQGNYDAKIGNCRNSCSFYAGVMDGKIKVT